jgi:D-galacturonate reductase
MVESGNDLKPVNVAMIGTGEYTTGYVYGEAAQSDKATGVVALVLMDLKKRGKTGRLAMVGVNGKKFPGIREHMKTAIGEVYEGLDLNIDTFPGDN